MSDRSRTANWADNNLHITTKPGQTIKHFRLAIVSDSRNRVTIDAGSRLNTQGDTQLVADRDQQGRAADL